MPQVPDRELFGAALELLMALAEKLTGEVPVVRLRHDDGSMENAYLGSTSSGFARWTTREQLAQGTVIRMEQPEGGTIEVKPGAKDPWTEVYWQAEKWDARAKLWVIIQRYKLSMHAESEARKFFRGLLQNDIYEPGSRLRLVKSTVTIAQEGVTEGPPA